MATILDTVVHVVADRHYEIVTIWSDCEWQIAIFDERKRRVGPIYAVTLETEQDARIYNHESALAALKEIAKGDLDTGRIRPWAETA